MARFERDHLGRVMTNSSVCLGKGRKKWWVRSAKRSSDSLGSTSTSRERSPGKTTKIGRSYMSRQASPESNTTTHDTNSDDEAAEASIPVHASTSSAECSSTPAEPEPAAAVSSSNRAVFFFNKDSVVQL
mmetsp:Transcript_84942/g.155795  ORF Transcript_84942/g.155795 Transcript_84942/m.155795 type:complete len:130 (-) Transcript_84942:32-421(-)